MSLKNKVLLSGGISTAAKVFRRKKNLWGEDLPGRFEDWMYKKCSTKKKMTYNDKSIYKLMRIAPKMMSCRVNMMYFLQTTIFLLIILKKMNSSHGNISFLPIVKLVTHTLQSRL